MKKTSPYFKPISTKVVITNIFMTICIIIIVLVLILIAQGYSLGESGGIERSGLLELKTKPSFTSISIDDKEQFYQGTFSKILPAKTHTISVTKDGYDTWTSGTKIESGLLTSIDWIRLFPKSQKNRKETVTYLDQARFFDVSPNRKFLVYLPKDSNELYFYNLESGDSKPTATYNIANLFSSTEVDQSQTSQTDNSTIIEGNLSISSWNKDEDRFILKVHQSDIDTWSIINILSPTDNINLSRQLSLNFTDLAILDDSANKLWGLENNNLRILDTTKTSIQDPLDTKVKNFKSYGNTVAYIKNTTKNNRDLNTLYIRKESAKKSSKVKDFKNDEKYLYDIGHYNKDWLVYSDTKTVQLLQGSFASDQKIIQTMKRMLSFQTPFAPTSIVANPNNRVLLLSDGKQNTAINISSLEYNTYSLSPLETNSWLDHYLTYGTEGKKIVARDFNGYNQRTVLTDKNLVKNSFAAIPKNSNYLYYLVTNNKASSVSDSTTTSNQTENKTGDSDTQKLIILKRLKL